MAQGVTYADLRFVRSPPEKIPQEGNKGEGELTYENIKGPRPSEGEETPKESKESSPWVKKAALGLLTTCLFFLATAVGFGIRYWQVSGQLRWASQDHADHTSVLAQMVSAQDESLAEIEVQLRQAKTDLNSTRETLRKNQAAKEMTQKHLEKMEEQLKEANRSLDAAKREKERTAAELRQATSCQKIGCCPEGWRLFRWKCLWVSSGPKSYWESQDECQRKASQLLVPKAPWDPRGLWEALGAKASLPPDEYWIGLKRTWSEEKWRWVFLWVDGSRYEGALDPYQHTDPACFKVTQGNLVRDSCSHNHRFICERPASSTRPDPDPRPF
ncbi:B-cell differentiation antigen CD72-like [Sceloporus undulatus]|uniref:B-cell differentiation antigen CD72-like n=1 Tax=Sceloporus undulatus TaxID=8520 RepID=UPI001C4C36A3|nr:B-cell differentiation antigen CD72-like [Sceloporus undulatus]